MSSGEMTMSISKAVSSIEMPLKAKHARATIIGTFHNRGAHTFWAIALRQPLQENRITAWKFCHLLHKILREGHPLCAQQSVRHKSFLNELGRLWGHLNDGYGICILHYTKFIIARIDFHSRNSQFPPNLSLKASELEKIVENDINFYFQLAVEMFDYLDEIIALQATIFNSITTFFVNSMTTPGQCRLAPLISLIQDSNPLYDFLVRIMFKLHANLPNDVLTGHRERFRTIFQQIKSFYNQSRNLQYFVNLIKVPTLPQSSPNFMSQVEFSAYTPPVVVIPELEPEPELEQFVDNLVDRTDSSLNSDKLPVTQDPQLLSDFERIITEKDETIQHLYKEINGLGKQIQETKLDPHKFALYDNEIAFLKSQLKDSQETLMNMRMQKDEIELKAQSIVQDNEKKMEEKEEKFLKLKTMYTQIRDEHIILLRTHGDTVKQLGVFTKIASDATDIVDVPQPSSEKCEMQSLLEKNNYLEEELNNLKIKYEVLESTKLNELTDIKLLMEKQDIEITDIKKQYNNLQNEKLALENENHDILHRAEDLDKTLKKTAEDLFSLEIKTKESLENKDSEYLNEKHKLETYALNLDVERNDLSRQCEEMGINLNKMVEEKVELQSSLNCVLSEKSNVEEQYQKTILENEELKTKLDENVCLTNDLRQIINDAELSNAAKEDAWKDALADAAERHKLISANMDRILEEKQTIESDLQDIITQQDELHSKLQIAVENKNCLENSLQEVQISKESAIKSLLEACIQASGQLSAGAVADIDISGTAFTSAYFMMISEGLQDVLNKLKIVNEHYLNDDTCVEGLARKVVTCGHLMANIHIQGMTICNTSGDIELGESIAEEIKTWTQIITKLFIMLQSNNKADEVSVIINTLKTKLCNITEMIHELNRKSDPSGQIGEMAQNELAVMEDAIEEAAKQIEIMLSKSRASYSGIKLEVNEKILDACTHLMQCIRILVQKSRHLQEEIVNLGKGSASVTEFYKRNHHWTEGLISAAKSVAQGANFLVSAANKAVCGDAKHQLDLIVAAQEIAASTAQLVVASRVKSPRGNVKLAELSQASRDVTQATGAVVATSKDCAGRLEDFQDMDLGKLTIHQAKTIEMEIQVKVLELEQALQMERHRLSSIRRKHYREN